MAQQRSWIDFSRGWSVGQAGWLISNAPTLVSLYVLLSFGVIPICMEGNCHLKSASDM
jgi:hypothetical protein